MVVVRTSHIGANIAGPVILACHGRPLSHACAPPKGTLVSTMAWWERPCHRPANLTLTRPAPAMTMKTPSTGFNLPAICCSVYADKPGRDDKGKALFSATTFRTAIGLPAA